MGILQGLTEFLPVSSSGHLVIGQYFFGLGEPELLFDIGVHFATMAAVVIYFRKDVFKLFKGIFTRREEKGKKTAYAIIIGTIPAVVVGLLFRDFFESLFNSPKSASVMLMITGVILLSSVFGKPKGKRIWGIKWFDALMVGIAQAAAILPGISRSGSTITAALHLGIEKEDAAKFSFLLALPAIFGATVLELGDLVSASAEQLVPLAIGMLSAGVTGYLAIAIMLKMVNRGKLYAFAPYCILLGITVLIIA